MRGSRDGEIRGGRDRRRGMSGGRSQMMINGVDVLDPTCYYTADEWTRLGWNYGRVYLS